MPAVPAFVDLDPVLIGLIVVLVGLFLFGYFLVRRTLLSLREGYEEGQR